MVSFCTACPFESEANTKCMIIPQYKGVCALSAPLSAANTVMYSVLVKKHATHEGKEQTTQVSSGVGTFMFAVLLILSSFLNWFCLLMSAAHVLHTLKTA